VVDESSLVQSGESGTESGCQAISREVFHKSFEIVSGNARGIWLSCESTKRKRLRHWLCSSRQLLRGSQQRGCMYHRSPLMRSLLSQFQTPTAPRRVSRFFRVWSLVRLPFQANHSAYFGSATIYFR